jgi:hypothetical protein
VTSVDVLGSFGWHATNEKTARNERHAKIKFFFIECGFRFC